MPVDWLSVLILCFDEWAPERVVLRHVSHSFHRAFHVSHVGTYRDVYDFSKYIGELGSLSLIKWTMDTYKVRHSEVLEHAAAAGHIQVVAWHHEHYERPNGVELFRIACQTNNLALCEWCYSRGVEWHPAHFVNLAHKGWLPLMQWVYARRGILTIDEDYANQALAAASAFGHLETVTWLYTTFHGILAIILQYATAYGQKHVVEGMFRMGGIDLLSFPQLQRDLPQQMKPDLLYQLQLPPRVDAETATCTKLLWDRLLNGRPVFSPAKLHEITKLAKLGGHLDLLELLKSEYGVTAQDAMKHRLVECTVTTYNSSKEAFSYGAALDNVDLAKEWILNCEPLANVAIVAVNCGFEKLFSHIVHDLKYWDVSIYAALARKNEFSRVIQLHNQYGYGFENGAAVFTAFASHDNLKALRWLSSKRCPWNSDAYTSCNVETAVWLQSLGVPWNKDAVISAWQRSKFKLFKWFLRNGFIVTNELYSKLKRTGCPPYVERYKFVALIVKQKTDGSKHVA